MNREELKQLILSRITREDGSLNFLFLGWFSLEPLLDEFDLPQFSSKQEKVYAIINDLDTVPKCFCGQDTVFRNLRIGYSSGCNLHLKNNPTTKLRREQTNLDKFGVEHVAQSEEIRKKVKQTMIKRFGVEHTFQSTEIKEKMKQTMLERYGVEHAGQSIEIKEKMKQTNLERYGVENVYGSKLIQEKVKQVNLERYGVERALQSTEIKEKMKQTNLGRFGVENVSQSKEVKEKVKQWYKKNFIENKLPIYLDRLKDQDIIPMFKPEEYVNTSAEYKFKHVTCGKEFFGGFYDGRIPSCPHCKIYGSSKIERKLGVDLELVFPQLIRNDRQLIKPREIDIVIDNIGIEVNGAYYHQADKSFDLLEKSNLSPIQLLHFWDFELYSKYDICLSIIKAKLNHFENKIFARKCDIHHVGSKEAELFFELNHLQAGGVKSSYYLGLYFNDELVQCISIGNSRFNKNVDLEIHRIATKLNTSVVGGIQKLWKQVLTDFPDKKIITYADKRISNGELYKRLGFTEQKDSSPNYFYVKNNQVLARYQCQKHKLPKLLGDKFNVELTEKENMILDGWIQIKDCGNKVFTVQLEIIE